MIFSLISSPRSGTTAFRSLLNQNRDVYLYGEVLYPDYFSWGFFSWLAAGKAAGKRLDLPSTWSKEYIPFLYSITSIMIEAGKTSVGVDLKWGQVEAVFGLDKVLVSNDLGVIHLVRKNTAATVLSQIRMEEALAVGAPVHLASDGSQSAPPILPITISGAELQTRIDELLIEERKIEQTFTTGQYLKVYYEDVFQSGNLVPVSGSLSEFLGARVDMGGATAFQKIGSRNLLEGVETDGLGFSILSGYMS